MPKIISVGEMCICITALNGHSVEENNYNLDIYREMGNTLKILHNSVNISQKQFVEILKKHKVSSYYELELQRKKLLYNKIPHKEEFSYYNKVASELLKEIAHYNYEKWLEYCEDDRTKGSMLADNVPCTLFFALNEQKEIVGAIEINHRDTALGHIHFGVVPWHRGKGYGTTMLASALKEFKKMGMSKVHICPSGKDNIACIHTVIKNGGYLIEEFDYDGIIKQRYEIDLG